MSIPGLIYPTSKGMLAGNPRDSAIANMNNASAIQAQANNAVGGRRRRVGGGNIPVPQFQMLYEPQGGPGTNPNNQIQTNAAISTQGAANAALDSGAFKKGGRRRRSKKLNSRKLNSRKLNSRKLKGGNPDWNWGCMSGGRKRRSCRRKRSNKRASRKRS
jgi:hypothetical protein